MGLFSGLFKLNVDTSKFLELEVTPKSTLLTDIVEADVLNLEKIMNFSSLEEFRQAMSLLKKMFFSGESSLTLYDTFKASDELYNENSMNTFENYDEEYMTASSLNELSQLIAKFGQAHIVLINEYLTLLEKSQLNNVDFTTVCIELGGPSVYRRALVLIQDLATNSIENALEIVSYLNTIKVNHQKQGREKAMKAFEQHIEIVEKVRLIEAEELNDNDKFESEINRVKQTQNVVSRVVEREGDL